MEVLLALPSSQCKVDMKLFVIFENGVVVGDPFPESQMEEIASGRAVKEFVPAMPPTLGPKDKGAEVQIVLDGDVCVPQYTVLKRTDEEIAALKAALAEEWAIHGHASWVFNDDTFKFEPPIPLPDQTNPYNWRESDQSWVKVTQGDQ